MKYKLLLAFVFLPLQLLAQKIFIYPTAPIAPQGSYQTVTAVITGVNDKTVTWTSSGGTIVGANPCKVNEPCTIALYSKTAGTFNLQATSNANKLVSSTATVTFNASPSPVTTHPRLMMTQAMLPSLQAKATLNSVSYQSIKSRASNTLSTDNAIWSWTCNGGTGQPSSDQSGFSKEGDAGIFALMSMVAPTAAERSQWGCYGHDVWVYVMKQILSGKEQIGGNHWSDYSTELATTTDWLMAGGFLNAADQQTARSFLAMLGKTVIGYNYGVSAPVTTYNNVAQLTPSDPGSVGSIRAMGNNYTMSKILILAAVGLTFNDNTTDDPPLANTCNATRYQMCPDFTAGSLHAYFSYLTGGMLYRMYAHLEDPAVTQSAYNLPLSVQCLYIDGSAHSCLGDGRGGESSEGSWYQYSMYRLRYALNMIHTAGYDDPILYGPQMSLGTSSWWDMKYVSDIEFLTGPGGPAGTLNSTGFNYLTTGDTFKYIRKPSDFATEASMLTADSYVGRTDRTNALRWSILNSALGGPLGTDNNCTAYCGLDSELYNDFASQLAMDMLISSAGPDPVTSLPTDPRPSLPSDLYNGSFNQHSILRTGNTLFSAYCPNTIIDHEHEFCGRFDIYSNGEYITKGRTEFNDYNDVMSSAPQSNTLAVTNMPSWTSCGPGCFMNAAVSNGGQFWHGQQQGFNTAQHSELPNYAAFIYNDTPAYNGWWAWSQPYDVASYKDATKVSRSMVWLRNTNQLAIYDRAVTQHPANKAVYLIATGVPTVHRHEVTWLTRSNKQRAYFTSVLPVSANVSASPLVAGSPEQSDDWEPAADIKLSTGNPLAVQYLSVLEWGAANLAQSTTTAVASTAGQNFDGTKIGAAVVMFMRDWPNTFTGVTYPASGSVNQYVSDLSPNTTYAINAIGAPTSAQSDSAGVLAFTAAGTGNIQILPTAAIRKVKK